MRGSAIAAGIGLLLTGIIIADILNHPQGTAAAANGIATVAKPSFNALLGVPS